MKNAKKILLFALALVALTLVMSLSIFAATTHEVATKAELNAAYASAQDGDTILLTADITCKCFYNSGDCVNGFMTITKAITLDLGGHTLELQNGWGGLRLKNSGCSVVNGKLLHTGRTCAIKVWNAKSIENLEIHIKYDGAGGNKTIGGIVVQQGATGIETIKNVNIHDTDTSSKTTTRGIESNLNGTITTPLIGSMENVTVKVKDTGMLVTGGKFGTFTNCSISGGVTGIEFDTKDDPSYSCSVDLEDCTVYGGSQTIYSHSNNKNGNVNIEADSQTELTTGESGKVFAVSHTSIIKDFEVPGYAQNADGSIAACTDHTWVDATCTAPKTCSNCKATEGDALGHTLNGEVTYSAPTCKDAGYDAETCTVCGETVVTYEYPADPSLHEKIWETEARNEADTGYTYTCNVCGGIVEEITKGTANEPIIVVPGVVTNTVYAAGAQGVIYQIAVSEYGKLVITFETENGAVIFADSLMTFMRGMFFQTYGTEFVTVVDPNNLWMGNYYFAVPANVASFNVAFVAQERPVLSLGENKIDATQQGTKVTISTPGDYILTAPNGANVSYCPDEYSSEIIDLPYTFTVNEGETVTFIVGTSSFFVNYEVVTLVLEENNTVHVHTEVEIPAVAAGVNITGYTAGTKCSTCDEVLVKPMVIPATNFKIAARSLAIYETITVNYKCEIPAGYENVYMVFLFDNREITITDFEIEESSGRYVFAFTGVTPLFMNENIHATVYAEVDGQVVTNVYEQYSIKQYCVNQLAKSIAPELRTFLIDFMVYGEKAQIMMNHNTGNLVTDGVDVSGKSSFTELDASYDKRAITGTALDIAEWKTSTLYITNTVNMQFKFVSSDLTGLKIKVNIKDRTQEFDAIKLADTKDSSGRYIVTFANITAIEFNETVTATFWKDGVQIGQTMTYSVNSYIQRNQDLAGSTYATLVDFLKAMYLYGKSAYDLLYQDK